MGLCRVEKWQELELRDLSSVNTWTVFPWYHSVSQAPDPITNLSQASGLVGLGRRLIARSWLVLVRLVSREAGVATCMALHIQLLLLPSFVAHGPVVSFLSSLRAWGWSLTYPWLLWSLRGAVLSDRGVRLEAHTGPVLTATEAPSGIFPPNFHHHTLESWDSSECSGHPGGGLREDENLSSCLCPPLLFPVTINTQRRCSFLRYTLINYYCTELKCFTTC